jgi:hypothetical protein
MSALVSQLMAASERNKNTELGKLLQWAALHITEQDEALKEVREEHAVEERERLRLERAAMNTKTAIEAVLAIAQAALYPPIELARDFAPQINLMAGHGDPDYLKSNGNSIRHVDCRETKAKRK